MINFAENLNKMITAGLGGETEAPKTEVAVGHRLQYLDVSGPVASFDTNIVAPLKKLLVNMLPIQAGSGDPSPDNVRPISGFDSVSVTRTGVNIWDEVWEVGNINSNNGMNVPGTGRIRSVNYVRVKPGTTYFASSSHTVGLRFYDFNKNYIGSASKVSAPFITPNDCYYVRFIITAPTYDYDTSINYPSSEHDYHPGTVKSVTIALGQTVYGGTLDVSTGKLIVTHGEIASYNGEVLPGEWISDRDVYAAGTTPTIGAQVVYVLDTPQTISLDPQQIMPLIGDNNVWSDAGDVDVTYTYYEETEGY